LGFEGPTNLFQKQASKSLIRLWAEDMNRQVISTMTVSYTVLTHMSGNKRH